MVRLENENAAEFKGRIKNIFGKHLDLSKHKIFFFGSRVTGKGSERSDIDIGILGDESVPREVLSRIVDELEELDILYKIDVVDFATAQNRFREVALQNVEYII